MRKNPAVIPGPLLTGPARIHSMSAVEGSPDGWMIGIFDTESRGSFAHPGNRDSLRMTGPGMRGSFSLSIVLTFLVSLSLFSPTPVVSSEKDIISYFPSWDYMGRNGLVNSMTIPYDKITIINYAFAKPLKDGSLVPKKPAADASLLFDSKDPVTGQTVPGSSMISMAHRHGAKVMLSIGGWEDTSEFPFIAADPAKTARFAGECAERIRKFGFDGIDIDWEYPGYVPHNGSAADKVNFTVFLKAIRDSLDALGAKNGRKYLLSAALASTEFAVTNMDVGKVASILDFLNIMTYDFFGVWDPLSNHNSPPAEGDSTLNVDHAFRLYHDRYGVPADKINLGVPFYGHGFAGCSGLHRKHSGGDTTVCFEPGNITYVEIVKRMNLFERHWDDRAKVPYLVNGRGDLFISYDDEESVKWKADYVMERGAGGLIIWEMTDDYFEDGRTPLLDAIIRVFRGNR
jgi:GH18 family chitinase